jgi:hypothetical protein
MLAFIFTILLGVAIGVYVSIIRPLQSNGWYKVKLGNNVLANLRAWVPLNLSSSERDAILINRRLGYPDYTSQRERDVYNENVRLGLDYRASADERDVRRNALGRDLLCACCAKVNVHLYDVVRSGGTKWCLTCNRV